MIVDITKPNVTARPELAKPETVHQQSQQIQTSAAPQPSQRPAPRRRPLWHLKHHGEEAKPGHRLSPNSRSGSP
jgi:hypothetical protein